MNDIRFQPVYLRGLPHDRPSRRIKTRTLPRYVLVIDVETTDNIYQNLLFGTGILYRVTYQDGSLILTPIKIHVFYAKNLSKIRPKTYLAVKRVAQSLGAELTGVTEFIDLTLNPIARNKHAVVTGYNLSFDLFSLASDVSEARNAPFAGGFSATFPSNWQQGDLLRNKPVRYREARAGIGHLRQFSFKNSAGRSAKIVDLSELVRALTETRHTLLSAGQTFGCAKLKYDAPEIHDPEVNYKGGDLQSRIKHYVEYNVNDVEATASLFEKAASEAFRHPINLSLDNYFSSAAIGKQYIRDMGMHAALCQCNDCERYQLGARKIDTDVIDRAMTGFFGARTDCLIRKVSLPAVYLDFTSDYPTQIILLGMWELSRAKYIDMREETSDVQKLLDTVTSDKCFDRDVYSQFCGVAEIIPSSDDLLPLRTSYKEDDDTANIALAHPRDCDYPLCFSILDLVVSKIRTGKAPRVSRAWRLYPIGAQDTLKPIKLYDELEFDPRTQNLFKIVVEERQKAKKAHLTQTQYAGWSTDREQCLCPSCKLERFLKVLANSIGYGIFSEMSADNSKSSNMGDVGGIEGQVTSVSNPETLGEFNFPPFATVITGGARLFLSMLQTEIERLGGNLIYCDTDSATIPASETGGEYDGYKLLTYRQIDDIRTKFNRLNPYDKKVVPELLKWEYPANRNTQLRAYCISTKRYCLYELLADGSVKIHKKSDHGLGQYVSPLPCTCGKRPCECASWIDEVWKYIIRTDVLGESPEQPEWFDLPAMRSWPVRTWHSYNALRSFNSHPEVGKKTARKRRRDQRIMPYRFCLAPTIAGPAVIGDAGNTDELDVRLIAPFTRDSTRWADSVCVDLHSHDEYRITTNPDEASSTVMWVKDYRHLITEYLRHAEAKYDDEHGQRCHPKTRGRLYPSTVSVTGYRLISKDGSSIYPPEEQFEFKGPVTYASDEGIQAFRQARFIFKYYGYTWETIAEDAGLTEWEARRFVSADLTMPRREALIKGVRLATIRAQSDLNKMDTWCRPRPGATHLRTMSAWRMEFEMQALPGTIRLPDDFFDGIDTDELR
jgi:hypothetical protein